MLDIISTRGQKARRILFFDHTAVLGGGEIALFRLVTNLDREYYEPIVVLGSDGELRSRLSEQGISTLVMPLEAAVANARKDTLSALSFLRFGEMAHICCYILKLARLIRAEKIDLVHTNSLKSDLLGGLAARLAGTPCLWHIRDRIASDYLPKPVAALFRQLCQLLPNQVVVNSCATLHSLNVSNRQSRKQRASLRKMDPTHVIYDGVEYPESVLQSDNLNPTVAIVGRISSWKGQHIFVDAAAKVLARHPNVRFHITGSAMFGEQEYETELRRQAESLGLDAALNFVGFQPNIAEYLKSVDVLVHASILPEPFGQVVIEGMAAGRPVIATDGGAIPEILMDGTTGILVPMGDADALAEAIYFLIANPEIAGDMGRAGYERVKQCFLIDKTAFKMQRLYEEMLGSKSKAKVSYASNPIL